MRVLLDTHIFLWIFTEPQRFSKKARAFVEDVVNNEFYLSDVSAWETSIKYGLGKLRLPESPETFFASRVRRADYRRLRIDLDHVTKVHSLPQIHRDPFDRLLISQAAIESMTILSEDPVFKDYAIKSLTLRDIS
ncbi:type II toxin-antitoxin system VapC family toxin [soil metagenome]